MDIVTIRFGWLVWIKRAESDHSFKEDKCIAKHTVNSKYDWPMGV